MTVKEIETTAKELLAKKSAELKILAEEIDKEAAAIERAKEDMEAATIAGDVKAYQQAKAARRDAEDAKEMHEARINALNNNPLMSQAEYEKAVASIYAEVAAIDDQTKQKLVKLSDQMEDAAESLKQSIDYANKVLQMLQGDIYKDADRSRDKNGRLMKLAHEDKAVSKWETVSWGKAGVTHYQYGLYTGRHVEQ